MNFFISNLTKKLTYNVNINKFLLFMWIVMMDLLPIHWQLHRLITYRDTLTFMTWVIMFALSDWHNNAHAYNYDSWLNDINMLNYDLHGDIHTYDWHNDAHAYIIMFYVMTLIYIYIYITMTCMVQLK